jgi:hypothetical protein
MINLPQFLFLRLAYTQRGIRNSGLSAANLIGWNLPLLDQGCTHLELQALQIIPDPHLSMAL